MNKFFTTLAILLTVVSFKLTAQGTFYPQRNYQSTINKGTVFGFKVGANLPRLYYTNSHLMDLPHELCLGLSGSVFVEFPFSEVVAFAPEINFQQKGGATSYLYEETYDVDYQLKAGYISIRTPFYFYVPVSSPLQPYVFISPEAGYAINGKISLSQPGLDIPESHVAISDANLYRLYAGALGGVGSRMNIALPRYTMIIKTEIAFNYGFLDTFSEKEHQETVAPTNVHAYNLTGKRYSRGIEVQVGLGFIRNKVDGCGRFSTYQLKEN